MSNARITIMDATPAVADVLSGNVLRPIELAERVHGIWDSEARTLWAQETPVYHRVLRYIGLSDKLGRACEVRGGLMLIDDPRLYVPTGNMGWSPDEALLCTGRRVAAALGGHASVTMVYFVGEYDNEVQARYVVAFNSDGTRAAIAKATK